ncbi:MAG TPA: 23S rRNA (pseudouridine(1915)-N(3))-methyltransferase RlmH [Chitinophagales bacterium]|nr:23S rRNA (pseudouridine(1915)-N(3))-methyltransferase RlmH [Chitinophagales bacterium]
MKITLLLTGKTTEPHIYQGLTLYEQRLKHYASFELLTLPDARNLTQPAAIKEKEAEAQLKHITPADYLMLLDEAGKQFTSAQFAQHLQQLMNRSVRQVKFLVGGAFGFHEKIYHRANESISLSPMTFSHQLVRLVFAEQLYRAFTILNNEPYHH